MGNCNILWWQEQWFLITLPFIFTGFGWVLKTWMERQNPYEKDLNTLKKIENEIKNPMREIKPEDDFDCFEEIRSPDPDSSISTNTRIGILRLYATFEKAGFVFFNKKVEKSWKRFLIKLNDLGIFIQDNYHYKRNENEMHEIKKAIPLFEKPDEFKVFIEEYNLFIKSTKAIHKRIGN